MGAVQARAIKKRVVIIGAGIVGLAVGLELTSRFRNASIVVLDKEKSVARHQTSHNSGVVHSGIYYKPGSLKATLCVEGSRELLRFCMEHNLPFEVCGKIIVATKEDELHRLDELFQRGLGNGLVGLRILSPPEIRELEPHAVGLRGIHVPGTAIVDFSKVASKYAELIERSGGSILLSHEVTALRRMTASTIIDTSGEAISADFVINCAGLHSDRISRMANANLDLAIVPFRGDYYDLVPGMHGLVKGLIYPVPDPQFPFLGVHFTRRIGGGVEAGPNAVLALKREGYTKTALSARDLAECAAFPGFWIMAARHWKMSVSEYYRSWNKSAFVGALQRLVPELQADDLVPGGSGVRAQALRRDGTLIDDFAIFFTDGMVHVCNVPSPAATASLAIAKHIVDALEPQLAQGRASH